jgi:hypothetical protein
MTKGGRSVLTSMMHSSNTAHAVLEVYCTVVDGASILGDGVVDGKGTLGDGVVAGTAVVVARVVVVVAG